MVARQPVRLTELARDLPLLRCVRRQSQRQQVQDVPQDLRVRLQHLVAQLAQQLLEPLDLRGRRVQVVVEFRDRVAGLVEGALGVEAVVEDAVDWSAERTWRLVFRQYFECGGDLLERDEDFFV